MAQGVTARPTGTLLGVDVGGTFTDFLIASEGGYRVHKALSTPDDPSRAVLEGVEQLGETPDLVLHGSTVATNAVLERRGARTALVATEGMRDLLVIGRQARPDIYDLEPQTPEPLVARELSFELSAKLRPDGSVEREAGPEEVARLVQQARDGGAEALAVSLLYAYANPRFEELFAELLEGETGDGLYLSISSQVSPEYREVERTATTVLNAYVGPLMSRYLQRLAAGLAERGTGPLRVLQSDGGAASAEGASRLPVATLLSGPAAGVNGAFALARRAGFDRILTFDMGGTSTDVALCDGALPLRAEVEIDGFRARTPVVDVHTVGAGGGSIARIDAGGALRVGPQSAGADPGPACYGTGRDFTVTDAQAVLGRLSGGLLGGAMSLDVRRSRRAAAGVVHAFEGDPQAAAQAVIDVATANMEHALRVVSVQRGFDPREFTLVAFGGAGPLHACALADALEMPAVLVPPMPGVLAALGAVRSDLTATRVRSVLLPLAAESAPALAQALAEAGEGALARLDVADAALSHALDLRYAGQSYELTIDLTEPAALEGGPDALEAELPRARAAFDELHEARYAHHDPDAPVEIVNVRVTARVPGADIDPLPEFGAEAAESSLAEVWFGGERLETRFVDRAGLEPGDRIEAPSIVTQLDSTTLVPPGWTATVDDRGNLLLERS